MSGARRANTGWSMAPSIRKKVKPLRFLSVEFGFTFSKRKKSRLYETDFKSLKQLNFLRITNLMRYLIFDYSGQFPSKAFLDEVVRQIFEAREDAQINLPFKHFVFRRYRRRLFLCYRERRECPNFVRLWRGQKKIKCRYRFTRSTTSHLTHPRTALAQASA